MTDHEHLVESPWQVAWCGLVYAWTGPNTCLGLMGVVAALATGGRASVVRGVIEAHGGCITNLLKRGSPLTGPISAITFGHVVLGASPRDLVRTRDHERVHVRQYERWGFAFLPAYIAASVWCWWQGADPYRENVFEREAYDTTEIVHD